MRDLRELSGPWVGFWVQDLERGSMRLALRFHGDALEGSGSDAIGTFTIQGHYTPESEAVAFTKWYLRDSIEYAGTWDGTMIAGRWQIGRQRILDEGGFEIWPEGDDEATERMEAALAATA